MALAIAGLALRTNVGNARTGAMKSLEGIKQDAGPGAWSLGLAKGLKATVTSRSVKLIPATPACALLRRVMFN